MPRRLLLAIVVLGFALAACVPATQQPPPAGGGGGAPAPAAPAPDTSQAAQPTTRYCASSTPTTAAGYQSAFNNLRKTYTEWASADGAVPVPLGGSRVLWMFGDTYIGKVASNGTISAPITMVNNSFVLQDGRCFTPLMGGAPLARTNRIPNPASGYFYWPASGVIDGGQIQIFMLLVKGGSSTLGFEISGMRVASFSTSNLAMTSGATTVPWVSTRPLGNSNVSDGTYVYIYGSYNAGKSNKTGPPEQRHYVARTPVGQVKNTGAWQYWNGAPGCDPLTTCWTPGNPNAAAPMTFNPGTPDIPNYPLDGPAGGLAVTPAPPGAVGYSYLGTAKLLDAFSDDVSVFTAPTPWGPWTYKSRAANTSFPGLSTYSAFTHLKLPGQTQPIVAFSTNDQPFDTVDQPTTIGVYGPRFVQPLPSSLP